MIAFNLVLSLLAVGGLALVVRLAHRAASHREPGVLTLPGRRETAAEREAA